MLIFAGSVAVIVPADGALAQTTVVPSVTGEGITPAAAKRDALRKALEQGAKLEIASYSRTENFELVRDTIFSRAEGLVTSFRVLDEGEGAGGIYYCTIRAEVSTSAVATAWGQVQNLLSQIGQPKVMVYITETIDDQVQTSSILESKIEERLIKVGFEVYDSNHLDAIQSREAAAAQAKGDVGKMASLAKGFGTQVFIMGHANANKASNVAPHGVALVMYNCDVQAKAFYTDTGRLLSSSSLPVTRGGARAHTVFSPQAAKMAMHNASKPLIDEMYDAVMRSWSYQISGGGEIRIEISGFSSVAEAFKLKRKFKAIAGVESVYGPDYTDGFAVYRIKATMTAADLIEYLVEPEWESLIEIHNVSLHRIQARSVTDGP